MAQRAIININGDLIPFSEDLDRLRTNAIGGGTINWVPEAGASYEVLNVTANGNYSAADAGVFGYGYVSVSVPGSSVTGKDPDTGELTEVHRDPISGEIVKTVLATRIRVTTRPTKTTYAAGETIDYTGIVVHAYSSTNADLGALAFSELEFPMSVAEAAVVPVQWPRTGDGAVLETTFSINVTGGST